MFAKFNYLKYPLEAAIDEKNCIQAIMLLKQGANPIKAYYTDTPLFIKAVDSKNSDLVNAFIDAFILGIKKTTPTYQDNLNNYFVTLINSAHEHFVAVAKNLITRYKNEKIAIPKTALEAARENKRELLEILLAEEFYTPASNEDVDWKNYYLSSLIAKNKIEEATYFIHHSFKEPTNPVPLFIAFLKRQDDLVITLLRKGTSPIATYLRDISIFEKVVELGNEKLISEFILACDRVSPHKEYNDKHAPTISDYFFQLFIRKCNLLKSTNAAEKSLRDNLLKTINGFLQLGVRPKYVYYFTEVVKLGNEVVVNEFINALRKFKANDDYPLNQRNDLISSCFILFMVHMENQLSTDKDTHILKIKAITGLLQIGGGGDSLYAYFLNILKLQHEGLIEEHMCAIQKFAEESFPKKEHQNRINILFSQVMDEYEKIKSDATARAITLKAIKGLLRAGVDPLYGHCLKDAVATRDEELVNEFIDALATVKYDVEQEKKTRFAVQELIRTLSLECKNLQSGSATHTLTKKLIKSLLQLNSYPLALPILINITALDDKELIMTSIAVLKKLTSQDAANKLSASYLNSCLTSFMKECKKFNFESPTRSSTIMMVLGLLELGAFSLDFNLLEDLMAINDSKLTGGFTLSFKNLNSTDIWTYENQYDLNGFFFQLFKQYKKYNDAIRPFAITTIKSLLLTGVNPLRRYANVRTDLPDFVAIKLLINLTELGDEELISLYIQSVSTCEKYGLKIHAEDISEKQTYLNACLGDLVGKYKTLRSDNDQQAFVLKIIEHLLKAGAKPLGELKIDDEKIKSIIACYENDQSLTISTIDMVDDYQTNNPSTLVKTKINPAYKRYTRGAQRALIEMDEMKYEKKFN